MLDVGIVGRQADKLMARGGGVHAPPEVMASWPRPNYIDPEIHDWAGPVVVLVVLAICITIFTARIWARLALAKNAGVDDIIMSVAMLPLIGMTIAVVMGCRVYGYQLHIWDQTKETYVTTRELAWTIELTYLASTSLIKISILCFYRRLANGAISNSFKYWVWGSIAFVIAYFISFATAVIFMCNPVQGYWRMFDIMWRLENEMKCNNEGAMIVAVVVVSTVQDFVICALPIFLVWNLQITKRQKTALIAIFAMGLLTCVCGSMRTYYAIYVYFFTYDVPWHAYYGWIWTALEAQLGVVCASAPALKIFFNRYFNIAGSRTGYSRSTGRKAYGYGNASPGNSFGNSLKQSFAGSKNGSRWEPEPVPLNQITVSTGMDIVIEDGDDAGSHSSHSSTRNLTATPLPIQHPSPEVAHSAWLGSRTTCTSSQSESMVSINQDVEMSATRH